jgi:hypothetical protein
MLKKGNYPIPSEEAGKGERDVEADAGKTGISHPP